METSPELVQVLQVYLQASDFVTARQIIEQYQDVLFQDDAHELLAGMAKQAMQEGQTQAAEMFAIHLGLLQACRQEGIEATFSRLPQAETEAKEPPPGNLPADFVTRCQTGLRGGKQEKQAFFNYLTEANKHVQEIGAAALVQIVQLAILEQDVSTLGKDLPPPYDQIWQEINTN